MDIKQREVEKMVKLLKAMGYKFVLQSPDGETIKEGLEVMEHKDKRTVRRGYFDELNLIDLIQDMDLADERVVDLRGTKFTAKEVAAQLSGMGIKKFGNQNFATCRIDDTTVSCMRTG